VLPTAFTFASTLASTGSTLASISGVAGDLVAVVLGVLIFGVLFLLLEGIDRI
jgi:hypothetical protein